MNKYTRLYNTIKYLKCKQIYFRLFYFIRNKYRKKIEFKYPIFKDIPSYNLILEKSITNDISYLGKNDFNFLNLSNKFEKEIDWNYNSFGKLWTYNIAYFDFLNQYQIGKDEALELIHDFIKNESILEDAIEPFPISLRGINWIKFLSTNLVKDININNTLFRHYKILLNNLEYHLLGNHLLENAFSLLFGAYYFEDEKLYSKAKEILKEELTEQILEDGAHFELTPMYHQIMLFRVLDCINLVKNNEYKNKELASFLESKASFMLGWLENMTYQNGEIPLVNDSAKGIAPTSKELFDYAKELEIGIKKIPLKDSGYRKVEKENYECIVDIGNIGPDYIPGHAHSDTFNFELYIDKKPFIVDTGLSTYETNNRRSLERSTSSHNTVEINGKNQSEVWGGFRVANRAKIINLIEKENSIESTHDGYKKDNVVHTRKWQFESNKIIITDSLNNTANAIFRLHFHPDIKKEEILKAIKCKETIKYVEYKYSPEFNIQINAIAIEITFNKTNKVEIRI